MVVRNGFSRRRILLDRNVAGRFFRRSVIARIPWFFRVETVIDMAAMVAEITRCLLTEMVRVKTRSGEYYREIKPGNQKFQWSTMVEIHSRSISRPFGKVNISRKFRPGSFPVESTARFS